MLSKRNLVGIVLASTVLFAGCSTAYKTRQEEKTKVAATTGHYCEFVNGDAHNDVDVELTLQMTKKCDLNKPYTMTNYKNASDIFGIVYCCNYQKGKAPAGNNAKPADGLD
ncbi:MAG: hypothetical protein B7Y39_13065 [Bdellovibrio sp. 28-41-41]|nr:MAG: hypothetical protein B7Y39_13065 [Bdellovibrio sp. 28-41-41]